MNYNEKRYSLFYQDSKRVQEAASYTEKRVEKA